MNDVIIKKADIKDLGKIQDLNHKLFELEFENFDSSLNVGWSYDDIGTKYFEDMLCHQVVLIALINQEIVGYLAGSINNKCSYVTKKRAEIDNMFVLEEYRRVGIGTELIQEFRNYCFNNKQEEIIVTANAFNHNAISFYQQNGFGNYEITLKCEL